MPQPQQHCALQQAILVALLQSKPQRPQSIWVGVLGGLGGPPPPCTVILNFNLSSPPDLCNRPKIYMRGIRVFFLMALSNRQRLIFEVGILLL